MPQNQSAEGDDMANDIADIGFRADTSDLVVAKRDLEALSPAAGKAEKASDGLNNSFARLNSASDKLMAAANALVNASNKLSGAIGGVAAASNNEASAVDRAANANSKKAKVTQIAAAAAAKAAKAADEAAAAALREAAAVDAAAAARGRSGRVPIIPREQAFVSPWGSRDNVQRIIHDNDNINKSLNGVRFNTANIAAQFQDIGVTAAMGMNPLQIALQQGTQLSAVFAQAAASGQSAAQLLVGALKQIVSATALVTIGVIAIGVALIQFVNWVKVAQVALNGLADILPVVAVYAAAAGAALAIAFAPAIAAAIWSITTAIAAGLLTVLGTLIATIGAIPLAIGLIIADLYIFRDEWAQVLGIDLIGYVKFGVNYIIGAFVGAYHDIKFLWSNFPDLIGAAAIGAANFVIRAVNAMISAAATGIDTISKGINGILSLVGADKAASLFGFSGQIPMIDASSTQFDEIANDAADRLANAVQGRNTQLQEDLTKDYLGAIGGAITTAATDAASKIKAYSATLGLGKAKKPKKGAKGPKTDEEKFDDIVNGAQRSVAALQAEYDAIGMSEEATARLKYETQLLNQAKQKNIDLSPKQRETLMGLANDMASLEAATKKAKDQLEFSKDLFKGFVSDLSDGLKNGESFWKAFGDAALNVLDKIVDKLLNDVIDALFEVNSAGSGGSGGTSLIGSLITGITSLFSAKGNAFGSGGKVSSYASGGSFTNSVVSRSTPFSFANGTALGEMGEAGPEGILPLTRMGNGDLGVSANIGHGGAANNNVPVPVNITVKVEGANGDAHVVELVQQGVTQGLQTFNDHVLPSRVNEIASDSRVR